jgi:membrane associated rhomboid family serine protease
MNGYESSDEHRPVLWLRGYPVYAAHLLVLVFTVSMLATTVLQFARAEAVLGWLVFYGPRVLGGEVWRLVTYGFVNPPTLWFVIDMLMIVWFGRELERFFGRRRFLWLYAGVYALPPLLFTLLGLWWPMRLAGESGAFALFVAFATLHPNAPIFFNLLAKWVAAVLVGLYTLMAVAGRDLAGLLALWSTTAFAWVFVRHAQGALAWRFPRLRLWRRTPKLRVLPDLPPAPPAAARPGNGRPMAEVDALLDKIARSGMASLTAKERAKLEAARAELLKREAGRS